jgi:hypothetical protein
MRIMATCQLPLVRTTYVPADREKFPLPERIFLVFTAVSRWATSGSITSPDRSGSRRGCANPLALFKVLFFLVMILLLPIFILPMMLVRLLESGRHSFRYGSAVDITAGDEARWGHGVLPPVPDDAVIRSGGVAIAHRDPGFRVSALTDWAVAATALNCQSLVSGDATCTRTFMANGLYRAHQALLELRARSEVSCAGAWRVVSAAVVGATRSQLVEEVRVRVRCQGWRMERHEPTGLTLRGGPEVATWSEDLTFARSAGAVTPASGGLPANRCPSCGAPLDLDPGGVCRYCKGVVTAGNYDWVMVSWQREPW